MVELVRALWWTIGSWLESRERLRAENLVRRHQLDVVRHLSPGRLRLRNSDRLLFVWLCRRWPGALNSLVIIQPETVVRWQPARHQGVLALEISKLPGSAKNSRRSPGLDSQGQPGRSPVGRAPDPWRALEIGDRCGSSDRGEGHGRGPSPAVANLEDVSPKPRRGDCFSRFPSCSDRGLQVAVRLDRPVPRAGAGRCTSPSPPIRPPTGSRAGSPRRFLGIRRPGTSFAAVTVPMVRCSSGGSKPWASGIALRHLDRPGARRHYRTAHRIYPPEVFGSSDHYW